MKKKKIRCPVRNVARREVIKRHLTLETCGQIDHICGCYIRFSNNKIQYSKHRSNYSDDVIVDYDENDDIVGIEFYTGL